MQQELNYIKNALKVIDTFYYIFFNNSKKICKRKLDDTNSIDLEK